MALELTERLELLASQNQKQPQLILEIEGFGTFGSAVISKTVQYGDPGVDYGDPGLVYGGVVEDPNTYDYINLATSSGGGSPITQQLFQDKGGSGSVSTVTIDIVDKNGLVTELISPGFDLTEILAVKARVYLNFEGGAHPEDSVLIFNGTIQDIRSESGSVKVTVAAPESIKRQDLFVKATTELSSSLNNSDTTINVVSTADFLNQADSGTLTTYIRIDDEIIQYTGTTSTSFTGCTRGALGTVADSHDDEASVESVYRLQGNLKDLSLKLMMSQAEDPSVSGVEVSAFVDVDPTTTVANGIGFDFDIAKGKGITVGDYVTITGATNGANNFVERTITGVTQTEFGSYIEVDGAALVSETMTDAVAAFKSKYDVLPEGLGMSLEEVDVARHEEFHDQFGANFFDYDFRLVDQEKGTEFINTQIYWPSGCYQLFRQGRASIGITLPPLAQLDTKTLNSINVRDPSKIAISRSTNKNFYNSVVYKFEENVLDQRFLQGRVFVSEDSQNRIRRVGNRPLTIEARGVRRDLAPENTIETQSRRFLDRYQFAAEVLQIKVLFGVGFNLEVGDIVIFGNEDLKISDVKQGNRNFQPRLMEITNKSMRISTGEIVLELTDTAFNLDGRYGVIGPSSLVGTGSTTTVIKITDSYGNADGADGNESFKWIPYIGSQVLVRTRDWSYSETVTLVEFDASDPYSMVVTPALSGAPSAGYIVDTPMYPTGTDPEEMLLYKAVHVFWDPQVEVVSGASGTEFDVGAGDVGKFFVGSIIYLHNADYSVLSEEVRVTDITGTTITVDEDLGFTPSSSELVELIGFPDEGLPYRWL